MVLFQTHQANDCAHLCTYREADEQVKEEFYIRLQDLLDNRKKHELLIVTGDMNAKIGEENWDYDKEIAKHGLGQRTVVPILRYE